MTPGLDPAEPTLRAVRGAGCTLVTGVPDSPLAAFASALDALDADLAEKLSYVPGTREDACLAMAAGEALAGGMPLVFMKSAGFGNCLDVLTSLVQVYGIPLVLLVSWAGHGGRDVAHHNVIGEPLPALCAALGLPALTVAMSDHAELERQLRRAVELARSTSRPTAVLAVPDGL